MKTTTKTKTLSTAAKAAKAIREELKTTFPGQKFSVLSSNYSMGNSVDISWTDGVTVKQVEEITRKYQQGHFNGMEDIYEYSNTNENIPQAKYVMCQREMSADVRETLKGIHNSLFVESCQITDDMNARCEGMNLWNSDVIYGAFMQYDCAGGSFLIDSEYGRMIMEMSEGTTGTPAQDQEEIEEKITEEIENQPDKEMEQAKKMNDLRFAYEAALGLVETPGIISNSNKAHAELIKKLLKSALQ